MTQVKLAVCGGEPIRAGGWPAWPIADGGTIHLLMRALGSGRWTISGPFVDSPLFEREFAEQYAAYNGVRFCVPTVNGSSALVIALESLGVGPGDEVIVPVLTWVATASAVLRVNATPVFVDIDPRTLCMSAEAARAAITTRTRAIIPVHLHHSMADMDAFSALSEETGIPVIEDTAQAHGAVWRGRRAGSIGRLGIFSFQQSKVLTCGEGGAVITNRPELYDRLQELRADSRRWVEERRKLDGMQLVPSGSVMGVNFCLSELHAAVLLGQMPKLEEQLEVRAANAEYLDSMLASLGGVRPLSQPEGLDRRTVYEYVALADRSAFGGHSNERICEALKAETGLSFYPPDAPLHRSSLYQPLTKRSFGEWAGTAGDDDAPDLSSLHFPVAEAAHRDGIICHHAAFLGSRQDMEDIAAAFEKVMRCAEQI